MKSYLQQLEERAAEVGVDLVSVCEAEGVALTTFRRWRNGQTTPREKTAERLFKRMDNIQAVGAA